MLKRFLKKEFLDKKYSRYIVITFLLTSLSFLLMDILRLVCQFFNFKTLNNVNFFWIITNYFV